MRTTLDLDADIVQAARQLARQQSKSIGQVISELARTALAADVAPRMRNGVPLFSRKPGLALVNRLRDSE
jgi:hypothetical protein